MKTSSAVLLSLDGTRGSCAKHASRALPGRCQRADSGAVVRSRPGEHARLPRSRPARGVGRRAAACARRHEAAERPRDPPAPRRARSCRATGSSTSSGATSRRRTRRRRCSSTSRGCGRRSSRTRCSSRARRATCSRSRPSTLDLERFRALVETQAAPCSTTATADAAATTLREALALWRGPPLADLANEPFAVDAARALDEERLAALEARIDADLARGRHARARRRADGARPRRSRCASASGPADARALSLGPPVGGARRLRGRAADARRPSSASSPGLSCRGSSRRS